MTASHYDTQQDTFPLRVLGTKGPSTPEATPVPASLMLVVVDEDEQKFKTTVRFNGAGAELGGTQAQVGQVIAALHAHDLDPACLYDREQPAFISAAPNGAKRFQGQFSHAASVFEIVSNDPTIIDLLTAAIEANPTVQAFFDEQQEAF